MGEGSGIFGVEVKFLDIRENVVGASLIQLCRVNDEGLMDCKVLSVGMIMTVPT